MSILDVLLIGAVLTVALWWIAFAGRARRMLRLAPIALLALAALQIALEGFYWQFIPAYFLIGVFALLSIFSRSAPAGVQALVGRISLTVMIFAALGPFLLMLPAPTLPAPRGPYPVGTETFRWIDAAREETSTVDPADRRNVIAQAWYPAAPESGGRPPVYMDGLHALPDMVTVIPGFMLRSYRRLDSHAVEHAAVAHNRPQWPVVLFSPGYGAPRAFYTGILAALASRGYVVLALDHPYESAIVELSDGQVATPRHMIPSDDAGAEAAMQSQLAIRVEDIRFVLDRIERTGTMGPRLSGRVDLQRIFAAGHSFGGAASAVAMETDARIRAAVNIDGTPYGDIPRLDRPFMLIESDHAETGHGEAYLSRNQAILDALSAPGWRFEIGHANHYSFTDAPLFFAPPGRFALSLLIGGSRGPEQTLDVTLDLLDAFFAQPEAARLENFGARYPGVTGGPASPVSTSGTSR